MYLTRRLPAPRTGINRTKAVAIGCVLLEYAATAGLLLVMLPDSPPQPPAPAMALLVAAGMISAAFFAVGVLREWRWLFWCLLAKFIFGTLGTPFGVLGLAQGASMYRIDPLGLVFLLLGLADVSAAVLMLVGYRRGGVWASF